MADDLDDEVEGAIEGGADATGVQAKREVQRNDSIAHGNLIAGLETASLTDELPSGEVGATLISTMPYSGFVEYGTGSYNTSVDPFTSYKSPDPKPPVGPIHQWVIRKGLTPDARIEFGPDDDVRPERIHITEQRKLAQRIAATIGKYGNKPHPFMRPAYRRKRDDIVDSVADSADDAYSW
jgi:hypothetical protein